MTTKFHACANCASCVMQRLLQHWLLGVLVLKLTELLGIVCIFGAIPAGSGISRCHTRDVQLPIYQGDCQSLDCFIMNEHDPVLSLACRSLESEVTGWWDDWLFLWCGRNIISPQATRNAIGCQIQSTHRTLHFAPNSPIWYPWSKE